MNKANLALLQKLKAAQHWRRRNIVSEQTGQNFACGPFLQFSRYDLPTLDRVNRPIAGRVETLIIDEILPVERAAHSPPCRPTAPWP